MRQNRLKIHQITRFSKFKTIVIFDVNMKIIIDTSIKVAIVGIVSFGILFAIFVNTVMQVENKLIISR